MLSYGAMRTDFTLQPISGKAVPVHRGEVMRISQVEGEQCVDFDAFNLHDYKEHMDVSVSRGSVGFRPAKGNIIFSNPPRFRPMLAILEMPSTCVTDLLGRTCNAVLFEASHGLTVHTACQDTLAESIGEYGLTPDDVHHSFNMWMNTEWDSVGNWRIVANTGKRGDYVDLMAMFDTLMVPITCGSGDVYPTSNFSFKPIQVQVFEGSPETQQLVARITERSGSFQNQRTPAQFRVGDIKADRELQAVPGYQPHFTNYPIRVETIEVPLNQEQMALAEKLVEQELGNDVDDVIRQACMKWVLRHRAGRRDWARIPATWL